MAVHALAAMTWTEVRALPVNRTVAILPTAAVEAHGPHLPLGTDIVIAEAMACGRPIVVSRAGGAAEIAQSGALFHEPGNSAELAARLTELVSDPARRAVLGANGQPTRDLDELGREVLRAAERGSLLLAVGRGRYVYNLSFGL